MLDAYIEKYGKRLYGLCRTLCTNKDDAEDLYQETWLKVHQKLHQYNQELEFQGWLTKICVNTYKDQYRKKKISLLFDYFSSQEEKDLILNSVQEEKKENFSDLHEAVHALPDKLKMTVILFYFQDLSLTETAKVLDIPEGTVKSRLSKARALLKEKMLHELEF